MKIKFRTEASQLNGKFWTGELSRYFMQQNQGVEVEAVRHGMNYYRLIPTGLFVHIYDAYEVETK